MSGEGAVDDKFNSIGIGKWSRETWRSVHERFYRWLSVRAESEEGKLS